MFTDSEPTQPCDIITAQPSELTTVAGTSMETETVIEIPAESLNLVVHIHSEDDEVRTRALAAPLTLHLTATDKVSAAVHAITGP